MDLDGLVEAVDRLDETSPSAVEIMLEGQATPDQQATAVTASGVMDAERGSYRLVLNGAPAGRVTAGLGEGAEVTDLEVVSQAGFVYVSDGALGLIDTEGPVRVEGWALPFDGALSEFLGPAVPPLNSTPVAVAEMLRHLDVAKTRDDRMDDVEGTTLRGSLELVEVFDELRRETVRSVSGYFAPGFGALDIKAFDIEGTVDVEVFVDRDGNIRRIRQEFDQAEIAKAEARSLHGEEIEVPATPTILTVSFDDFDERADIQVPVGAIDASDDIAALLNDQLFVEEPFEDQVEAEPPPEPSGPTLEHDINIYGAPGTCLTSLDLSQVPCRVAHDIEVIALVDLGPEPYPGRSELARAVATACFAEVAAVDPAGEFLSIASQPSEEAWSAGDHEAVCTAVPANEPVEGSLLS